MFRFENLEIWKLSLVYGKKIYQVTDQFPKHELFGLSSQLKRALLSISSNIAEGSGSRSIKDFSNFLDIAIKSVFETVSQLFFAKEMGYLSEKEVNILYAETEVLVKKIQAFRQSLQKNH